MAFTKQDHKDYKVPTKVYDVEKKLLIGTFESLYEAAKYLGVSASFVQAAQRTKCRIYKNKLGIIACIR